VNARLMCLISVAEKLNNSILHPHPMKETKKRQS
jgi:hypothetical protein